MPRGFPLGTSESIPAEIRRNPKMREISEGVSEVNQFLRTKRNSWRNLRSQISQEFLGVIQIDFPGGIQEKNAAEIPEETPRGILDEDLERIPERISTEI